MQVVMRNRLVRCDGGKDSFEKSERGCLRYIVKSIVAIVGLHISMSVSAYTITVSYPTAGGTAVAPIHEIRTEVVNGVEWTYMTGFIYIEQDSRPKEVLYADWISMNPNGASGLMAVPGYWGVYIGDGTNAAVSASISGHVNVPSVLGECRVIGISANAFSNCTAITSVTVPNEVVTIQDSAFTGCSGITEMTLPFIGKERGIDGVRDAAFGMIFGERSYDGGTMTRQNSAGYWYSGGGTHDAYCIPSGLRSLTITDETILSRDACCELRNLQYVSLPPTLAKIGDGAFNYCINLRSIVVPSSVKTIGSSTFRNCISMTNAVVSAGVDTIGDHAFCDCWTLSNMSLPESLTVLDDEAFKGTAFTTLPLMPGIRELRGEGIFRNCTNLRSANLPASVRYVGNATFENCTALTNVVVGSCVTNIGAWAFHECIALESISLPENVKSIGSCAFNGCTSLVNVSLSEGLEILGDGTFSGCTALAEIDLPDSVVDLGRGDPYRVTGNVFRGCTSLRSVKLPTLLKFLPDNTFWGCNSLADIELPSGVESIGSYAFCDCDALEELTLPPAVTNIARGAFSNCKALKGIVAQGTIKMLGSTAFYYCSNLKKIEMHGNAPAVVDWMPFMGVSGSCCVYVPVTSSGWGANIPGNWNGVRIDYLPFDVSSDEDVVIAPQGNQTFTVDDVARFVGKATPGKGREGQSEAYFKAVGRITKDGAVVIESAIDEASVELPVTAKEVLDASMSVVDMTADAPSITLPAESVKEGFYYGVAAAGSLDALNGLSPDLSRASGGTLQVSVAKPAYESAGPTKTAAFFKVVISDKQ